jgi:4a-hydroxytetrahydrobiopterin dehydratase
VVELSKMKCVPCSGKEPALSEEEIGRMQKEVNEWTVERVDGVPQLKRAYRFKNFAQALAFTNRVGEIAEQEDHHPALLTEWGKVTVTWWTHAIKGLHSNDFIMAAKTDELYRQ